MESGEARGQELLERAETVHFLGIGGIGISGVARLLHQRGRHVVRGSDIRRSSITDALQREGIEVVIGHDPQHVLGADVVVVSTAIPDHNVELRAAREQGTEIVHRSVLLDALSRGRRTIGVTGTHGKGTVSSMIAWILECAGWRPGFVIGAMLHNFSTNARDGEEWMILEVDESDGTHKNFALDYAVCNFLEVDHLNYYDGLDDIINTMAACLNENERLKELFVNLDCEGNRRMVQQVDLRPTGYALHRDAEFRARFDGRDQMPIRFEGFQRDRSLGHFELNLFGRYNALNAIGAIAVARRLGVEPEAIRRAIATYAGMENRFTVLRAGGRTIVKDYQSHPTGMRKVLESARDLVGGRVISVFKPYRYTLMHYLQDEYPAGLQGSDEVVITTMYAAEEDPIEGVDTASFVEKLRQSGLSVTHLPDQRDINAHLLECSEPGDKIIFFGGDDFFRMADAFAAELARRHGEPAPQPPQPQAGGPLATDGGAAAASNADRGEDGAP